MKFSSVGAEVLGFDGVPKWCPRDWTELFKLNGRGRVRGGHLATLVKVWNLKLIRAEWDITGGLICCKWPIGRPLLWPWSGICSEVAIVAGNIQMRTGDTGTFRWNSTKIQLNNRILLQSELIALMHLPAQNCKQISQNDKWWIALQWPNSANYSNDVLSIFRVSEPFASNQNTKMLSQKFTT